MNISGIYHNQTNKETHTMYGKIFAKMFEGSMVGAGATAFAVMSYAISKQCPPDFTVELNAKFLGAILGEPPEKVESAIEYLCSPDPISRTEGHDGRRLVKVGSFTYFMVNGEMYHNIRSYEERKEYNRAAQAKYREKMKKQGVEVPDTTPTSEATEPEAKEPSKKFKAPTIEECKARAKEIKMPEIEGEKFFNYYGSKGWKIGVSPMKNWHMAMANWLRGGLERGTIVLEQPKSTVQPVAPQKPVVKDYYEMPGLGRWDLANPPKRSDFREGYDGDSQMLSAESGYRYWKNDYQIQQGIIKPKPNGAKMKLPIDIPNKGVSSQIADPDSPEEIEARLLRE